jgi:hypothetical protein
LGAKKTRKAGSFFASCKHSIHARILAHSAFQRKAGGVPLVTYMEAGYADKAGAIICRLFGDGKFFDFAGDAAYRCVKSWRGLSCSNCVSWVQDKVVSEHNLLKNAPHTSAADLV